MYKDDSFTNNIGIDRSSSIAPATWFVDYRGPNNKTLIYDGMMDDDKTI